MTRNACERGALSNQIIMPAMQSWSVVLITTVALISHGRKLRVMLNLGCTGVARGQRCPVAAAAGDRRLPARGGDGVRGRRSRHPEAAGPRSDGAVGDGGAAAANGRGTDAGETKRWNQPALLTLAFTAVFGPAFAIFVISCFASASAWHHAEAECGCEVSSTDFAIPAATLGHAVQPVVVGAWQASDPLSFMHPPLVVPDALRLSGLAALSGVPLPGGGEQALRSAAASAPSQPQHQQQPQSRQAAAAAADAPPTPGSNGGVGAAADGGGISSTSAPLTATRRPAEQAAAPTRGSKRTRAAEQRPAANARSQEQQRQDEPSAGVASTEVPAGNAEAHQGGGAVPAETASAALASGNAGAGPSQAELMEGDGADMPAEVCSLCQPSCKLPSRPDRHAALCWLGVMVGRSVMQKHHVLSASGSTLPLCCFAGILTLSACKDSAMCAASNPSRGRA